MSKRLSSGLCVLMAEDSEDDVFFVKRGLAKAGIETGFFDVPDGAQAIAYLRGEGKYSDRKIYPFPNVLLCDLKMPIMDGYGVLSWLQQHPECKVIPTIVFSSSALESDIKRCYDLGANAYMQKPGSLEELGHAMKMVYEFWSLCEVPPVPPGERCS